MEYLEINKEKIIAKDEGQGAHTLLTRVGGAPPTSWAPWWLSDDHRYYEFMCFDIPKVVRSPKCDQGHDEESQNVRDIKIDIFAPFPAQNHSSRHSPS